MTTLQPAHNDGISPAGTPLANPGDHHTFRNTDPLAVAFYKHAVKRMALPDRRLVVAALDAVELQTLATPEVQIHREALRECITSRPSPTRGDWEDYRREHDPREEVLKPAGDVAQMLGGGNWRRAADAVRHQAIYDPTAYRLTRHGDDPTPAQLIAMLRECAKDLGHDYFGPRDYMNFADRTKALPRDVPIVLTTRSFLNVFGGFAHARHAAGLRVPDEPPANGRKDDYERERILGLLRDAHDAFVRTTGPRPAEVISVAFYKDWREKEIEDAYGRDETLVVPHPTTFSRHFGGWPGALVEAGVVTYAQSVAVPAHRSRARPKWYLAWSLLTFVHRGGDDVSANDYESPGGFRDTYAARPEAVRPASVFTIEGSLLGKSLAGGRRRARTVIDAGGWIDELLADLGHPNDRPSHIPNHPPHPEDP